MSAHSYPVLLEANEHILIVVEKLHHAVLQELFDQRMIAVITFRFVSHVDVHQKTHRSAKIRVIETFNCEPVQDVILVGHSLGCIARARLQSFGVNLESRMIDGASPAKPFRRWMPNERLWDECPLALCFW